MPMWRAVRMIRRAISPRLAIRSLRIRFHPGCRTLFEEGGKAFFSLRRGAARGDPSGAVGADRVVYGAARIVGDTGLRVAHGAAGGVQLTLAPRCTPLFGVLPGRADVLGKPAWASPGTAPPPPRGEQYPPP